jgi:hypothetical protein
MNQPNVLKEADVFPAPELPEGSLVTVPWESDLPHPPRNKWEREYQTFLQLRPGLLESHRNQFVAIHEGQVVDSGDDAVTVALRVYARYGQVPIYVGQVTERRRVVRMPSVVRNASGPTP